MTAVAVLHIPNSSDPSSNYSAAALGVDLEATGPTVGEAIEALTSKLGADADGALIVVQSFQPDQFFSAAQIKRLRKLLDRQRSAELTETERAELDNLIEAELVASGQRAEAIATAIGR